MIIIIILGGVQFSILNQCPKVSFRTQLHLNLKMTFTDGTFPQLSIFYYKQ